MTKYGSFRTSLNGATGAIVGISSSLLLSLSSLGTSIPEPKRSFNTSPETPSTNRMCGDTYFRSSSLSLLTASLGFICHPLCLLNAAIALFIVPTLSAAFEKALPLGIT